MWHSQHVSSDMSNEQRRPCRPPAYGARTPGCCTAQCLWVHLLPCQQRCKDCCPTGQDLSCQLDDAVRAAKTGTGIQGYAIGASWGAGHGIGGRPSHQRGGGPRMAGQSSQHCLISSSEKQPSYWQVKKKYTKRLCARSKWGLRGSLWVSGRCKKDCALSFTYKTLTLL